MQLNLCPKLRGRPRGLPVTGEQMTVVGTVVVARTFGLPAPGKSTTLRLYSSTNIDRNTGKGKLSSMEASIRGGKNTKHGKINTITYHVSFQVELEFGSPGAIVVKNENRHEFFLKSVSLQVSEQSDDQSIHFDCNSWVHPFKKTKTDRLFFINTIYLPSKTPEALRELRQEELQNLRGDGRGERKDWERNYDYDYYNDLGDPSKEERVRPVLGGTKSYPYPRRIRTGRPLSKIDSVTETRKKFINLDFYIPPDERFSPSKLLEFLSSAVQAVKHFVIPEVKSLFQGDISNYKSFDQLKNDLYSKQRQDTGFENMVMEKLKVAVPSKTYKGVAKMKKENPVKFPIPQVIKNDDKAWRSDEEFAREMIAGLNPIVIKLLETFPPVGIGGEMSSITSSHIEGHLEGLTIDRALEQKRIFILDHHDYLIPYIRRINAQGACQYASRTLLFLKDDGALKPVVIELSLPGDERTGEEEISRIFTPARDRVGGELWNLAKAHVSVNDSVYHQLMSHWLFTHATVEPFIIATRRQLSAMHPIHKLLDPHFKDNMQINTLARSILLNAGGILEKTLYPGRYAMEMSSTIYESWRFTEQALPNELLKRGVAIEDPKQPSGVSLLIEDYPYAVDGLEVWVAIKKWVGDFCAHFYHNNRAVIKDDELQGWWDEIRLIGHGDKRYDDKCWLHLDSVENLVEVLTTLIWIASALHASLNFGQYGYAGFPPNRPTRCRKFIPTEGTPEFAEFERDPEKYFLEMIPDRFITTLGIALIEVLSTHMSDELYLGQRATTGWTDEREVLRLFDDFRMHLLAIEKRIADRNRDPVLKNRRGPVKVPYTLLYPDTSNNGEEKGVTGKGIPNSVSI